MKTASGVLITDYEPNDTGAGMEDHGHSQDRQQLEQVLLEQIRATEKTYRCARELAELIVTQYAHLPLEPAAGNVVRRKAAANEAMARTNYRRVLNTFKASVISGRRPAADAQAYRPAAEVLTRREIAVLKLIVAGLSTKELAVQLGISFRTATAHRSRLMDKLDIHDMANLVRYAVRNKLGEP